jgi:hypothetical protein
VIALFGALLLSTPASADIKDSFGRILDVSYTSTSALDSDDLDCAYPSQGVTIFLRATTSGTLQAYYVPLRGETAGAVDSAVAITADTIAKVSWAQPMKRSRFRFTPGSSTGSVWIDAYCTGATR